MITVDGIIIGDTLFHERGMDNGVAVEDSQLIALVEDQIERYEQLAILWTEHHPEKSTFLYRRLAQEQPAHQRVTFWQEQVTRLEKKTT